MVPINTAWRSLRAELLTCALVLLLALVSQTVLAQPFRVPSGSMEPTLQIGDELLASKFSYGYSRYALPAGPAPDIAGRLFGRVPARGDVVVFRLPRDPDTVYVKRVIGLPGDRIQMKAGRLWINGTQLPLRAAGTAAVEFADGRSIEAGRFIETLPGGREHVMVKLTATGPLDNTPEFVVPADSLFMMGDNRDNSLDSRVPAVDGGVGFVPLDNVVGRARVVLGSFDFLNVAWNPATWLGRVRASRFLARIG